MWPTSYNIYRGTSSGGEALVTSGVTGTTFTDTTVNNFVTYYYQVTAANAGGASAAGTARQTKTRNEATAMVRIPELAKGVFISSPKNPRASVCRR